MCLCVRVCVRACVRAVRSIRRAHEIRIRLKEMVVLENVPDTLDSYEENGCCFDPKERKAVHTRPT